MTIRQLSGAMLAGWHELPVVRSTDAPTRELLAHAVHGALRHAGLEASDVDGFAVGGFTLTPDHAVDLARQIGLRPTYLAPQEPGGSGALAAVMAAAEAVRSGVAEVVVCAAADRTDPASMARLNSQFSTVFAEALEPIGGAAANVLFAFIEEQYLRRYGITREHIGRLAVALRRNGSRHPNTLFPTPLTVQAYLDARPVAEPLSLYDCVLPGSGAAAVIVTSAERAQRLGRPAVEIRAGFTSYNPDETDPLQFGWYRYADELFTTVGIDRGEVSGLQLYDDYPIMVACQLSELGFSDRRGIGTFDVEHDFAPNGRLPLNTGGGMLSCGQAGGAGGYIPIVEAARQLAREAPGRQIQHARSMLVTGLGMVGYTRPQSLGAALLTRSDI